jgi:hypothetical protein
MTAEIKPSTLGWWDKCSTTVLLLLYFIFQTVSFCHFHSPGASNGCWDQTLNLGMMRQVFYNYAITAVFHIQTFMLPYSPSWCQQWLLDQTLNLGRMRQVSYNCTITAVFYIQTVSCHHFLPPGASNGCWDQTLNLGMMRQVFYNCTITAVFHISNFSVTIFSNPSAWDDEVSVLLLHYCCWLSYL